MSRLLTKPKALAAAIALGGLFVLGLLGGALGNEFGGGFLGSPIAHIQLPAENITATPAIGDFNITNTMMAGWAAILVLALLSFLATWRVQEVPGRLQSLMETVLEFFLSLAESVAGPEKARRFFPLVMTIFLFIVTANWMGILPGYGTVGRFEPAEEVIAKKAGQRDFLIPVVNLYPAYAVVGNTVMLCERQLSTCEALIESLN